MSWRVPFSRSSGLSQSRMMTSFMSGRSLARVPCPPDLTDYDVVFKSSSGHVVRRVHITQPLTRRGDVLVSACRVL